MIDIGFNSAVINVKVDTECYSRLMYGLKPNKLTGLVMNADMLTDHKFEILNLLEGKKYYFQIEFYNNDFSVKTAIKEIQTLGIATPEILNKKIECYVKSAELSIKTNVPVKYRLKTAEQIL
ncbi:MAG TPA: hypothetical protein PLM75_11460, partial [bacterium]|nr:hypothetical protein [bacterium]